MVLSSAYPQLSTEWCHQTGSQLRKYLLATAKAMRRNIFALYIYIDYLSTYKGIWRVLSAFRVLFLFSGPKLLVVATKSLVETWVQVVYGCSFFSQVNGRRCEKKRWVHAWCMPFLFALGFRAVCTIQIWFAIAFVRWWSEKSFNLPGTLVQLVSSVPGPANSAGCPGSWLLWWESWDLCWALQERKPQLHEYERQLPIGLWNCRFQRVIAIDLFCCKFYCSEVPLWIVLAFDSIMLMLLMSVILLCRPQEFQWLVDDWHDYIYIVIGPVTLQRKLWSSHE